MDFLNEFIAVYGSQILMAVITGIFGYIGSYLKKAVDRLVDNQIKKSIVADCVKFVEQIYTDLHGDEKLKSCIGVCTDRLNAEGIKVDDVELWTMIEACVNEFNRGYRGDQ